jgi:2',3'-cyclic-nucleotide 2'-phosphodiesterase (5'-nucleotidase family)
LHVTEIAYEHFFNFSKFWGDKYVASNVQVINPATGKFEYIGKPYRYFETGQGSCMRRSLERIEADLLGLRIMAFGLLYDFTGNSNVSKVIKAKALVQQKDFLDAVNFKEPIDLFLVIGHNPVRPTDFSSTFSYVYKAIRAVHAKTPIQIFGGHSHIRDFVIYDGMTTALESG